MKFRAVCNKVVFTIEASSERMAKSMLKHNYGIDAEVERLSGFRYDKNHLFEAHKHERGIYGRV